MVDLPYATWLRTFEAAARHGSFSTAADELGLTPAAVSQQIRLLEKHLGTKLFERLPRGVALTDMGQAYSQPVRKSFSDLEVATRGLFGSSVKHVIRVRASISHAALVIAPRLGEFHNMYPDIEIQLSTFVWADRFGDSESDIDIRFGHGEWRDGSLTHLGPEYAIPVCHSDYAKSFGKSFSINAMAEGHVAIVTGSEADWINLSAHCGLELGVPSSVVRVDSSLIALQTIAAGHGAVMVLENFAAQYLRQGLLIAPFDLRLPISASHYLIRRDATGARDEVRLFENWVMSLHS